MRRWSVILFLVGLVGLCTGCGIQNQAGDVVNSAASGGSAGAAPVHVEGASDRNPLCNGKNYYESSYDGESERWYDEEGERWTVSQMEMDGTVRQTFPMEKYGELAYVREDELFYLAENGGLEQGEVWCVPIRHTKEGDVPQFEKAEKLLTEEPETRVTADKFYADDQYILYITDNYDLRAYDRKVEKFLKVQDVLDKKGLANDMYSIRDSMIGGTFFFCCKYSGLYSYTLGEEKVKKIDGRTHGAYTYLVCPEQKKVYYEACKGCDGKDKHGKIVLYSYDCTTGAKQEYMTGEQWRQAYQRTGVWKEYQERWCEEEREYMKSEKEKGKQPEPEDAPLPEPSYFIDGTRLYAMEEQLVLSLDLAGDRTPRYEKDLSNCLRSKDYDFYDIVRIDRGVCYFEHEVVDENETEEEDGEEKTVYGYYDLAGKRYVQTKVVVEE